MRFCCCWFQWTVERHWKISRSAQCRRDQSHTVSETGETQTRGSRHQWLLLGRVLLTSFLVLSRRLLDNWLKCCWEECAKRPTWTFKALQMTHWQQITQRLPKLDPENTQAISMSEQIYIWAGRFAQIYFVSSWIQRFFQSVRSKRPVWRNLAAAAHCRIDGVLWLCVLTVAFAAFVQEEPKDTVKEWRFHWQATREAVLNRSPEHSEARLHTFHNTTAVYDLLTIALVKRTQFSMLTEVSPCQCQYELECEKCSFEDKA